MALRGIASSLALVLGLTSTLCLALVAAPSRATEAPEHGTWSALGDKDGVKLWRLDVPGRVMPGFRGEVLIGAAPELIVRELEQVDHHTEWMYRCAESRVVKRFDRDHALIYNRTDTPWPVWDRDAVLDTRVLRESAETITLAFTSIEGAQPAAPQRVVRVPKLEGVYRLSAQPGGQTRVTYEVVIDIGGSVPQWVAERVARDMPYHTLAHLRDRMKQPE